MFILSHLCAGAGGRARAEVEGRAGAQAQRGVRQGATPAAGGEGGARRAVAAHHAGAARHRRQERAAARAAACVAVTAAAAAAEAVSVHVAPPMLLLLRFDENEQWCQFFYARLYRVSGAAKRFTRHGCCLVDVT